MARGDGATVRGVIKTGIAQAFRWSGASSVIRVLIGSRHTPLVVGYHRVVEHLPPAGGDDIPAMLISRRMLQRHFEWIGRRFRFVSLEELGARLEEGRAFDRPVAAVTFDDGYRDVYENAFPLLKRMGIPAAAFVVTDLVGSSRLQTHDKLYVLLSRAFPNRRSAARELARLLLCLGIRLPRLMTMKNGTWSPALVLPIVLQTLPQADVQRVIEALETQVRIEESALAGQLPLTWEMLVEMQRAGVIIGSHTKTHAWLTNESRGKVAEETSASRRELERRLGTTVKHFAYPDGRFNAKVVATVAAAGYRFAYTTCAHRDARHPRLTIPRKLLWENTCLDAGGRFSSAIMSCYASGVFDLVGACGQDHEA